MLGRLLVLDVAGAGTFPVELLTPSCAAADAAPLATALAATARSLGAAVA